ncbi:hypothetical protein ACEN8K_35485, partial [Variovorax sp. CT11-76]
MSLIAFQGSLEVGLIFALVALGVFISFRVVNFPDLTVDGSFRVGSGANGARTSASSATRKGRFIMGRSPGVE